MPVLLQKYWLELIFGFISAGALAFCKYLHSQIKEYKKLLELREIDNIEKSIDEKLQPVYEEIKKLEKYIEEIEGKEDILLTKTISAWGFRITQLCEIYLEQGYMTRSQYIQLVEMYNLYSQLGGNGKVKEFFLKTTEDLEVKNESK